MLTEMRTEKNLDRCWDRCPRRPENPHEKQQKKQPESFLQNDTATAASTGPLLVRARLADLLVDETVVDHQFGSVTVAGRGASHSGTADRTVAGDAGALGRSGAGTGAVSSAGCGQNLDRIVRLLAGILRALGGRLDLGAVTLHAVTGLGLGGRGEGRTGDWNGLGAAGDGGVDAGGTGSSTGGSTGGRLSLAPGLGLGLGLVLGLGLGLVLGLAVGEVAVLGRFAPATASARTVSDALSDDGLDEDLT